MEVQVIFKDKVLVKFPRNIFLEKLEHYFKGDIGLLTEAFNEMEKDLKKEILKL